MDVNKMSEAQCQRIIDNNFLGAPRANGKQVDYHDYQDDIKKRLWDLQQKKFNKKLENQINSEDKMPNPNGRPVTGKRKRAISVTIDQDNMILFGVLGNGNISEGIAEMARRYKRLNPKEIQALKAAAKEEKQENDIFS